MLVNLNGYGLISIAGAKPKDLLQGQLTCDMEALAPGASLLAAHCNPKGRVQSFFHVFNVDQHYYLFMPRHTLPLAQTGLQKYAPFFKTTIEDVTHEIAIYGSTTSIKTALPDFQGIEIVLHGPENRYLVLDVAKQITLPVDQNINWHWRDIQVGIPSIYPETAQKYLPHELNLPELGAVSFTKGCYTGQEIIARMQYRGQSKRKLLAAHTNSCYQVIPGADIYNAQQQTCGSVVDYHHGDQQQQLLVLLDDANTSREMYLDKEMQHACKAREFNNEQ